MNSAPSSAPIPSAVSMPVRLRGRMYPSGLPGTETVEPNTPELAVEKDAADIRLRLGNTLWRRLEFAALDGEGEHDKDDLIESYNKSLSRIVGFGKDASGLIRAVCKANLEFRAGEGIQDEAEGAAAVQRKLEEMIRKAVPTFMPSKNVLTAEFVTQSSSVMFKKLQQSLRAAVGEFVEEFFAALDRLVDRRVAGLIEWVDDNLCRYHFFKEVVIHQGVRTETTIGEPWREAGSWSGPDFQTVTTKRTVENEYRLARHEHHVTHAFHTSIGNSRVVVPLAVQKMIVEIPDWLTDCVDMIDGSLFREIIIEREYKREKWTDVQTRDEPLPGMGWEPAVVIGPIVLTGWGPREIDAELARRKEAAGGNDPGRAESLGRWRRNGWAAIAASAHVVSAVLMIRAFGGQSGLALAAMGLFLVGAWGAIQGLSAQASFHRLGVGGHRLIVAVGALLLLPASVHASIAAVNLGSGSFVLAAVTLLAAAGLFGAFAYRAFWPEPVSVRVR